MSKEKLTFKERIVEAIDAFFNQRIPFFWIFLCIIVAVIIGIFAWNEIDKNIKQKSTSLVEKAQDKYSEWVSEKDTDDKAALEDELLADLSSIIKKYPNQYATFRALFIRARMFSEKEKWEEAAKNYSDIAESFSGTFYAPVALFNAAVCYEEMNKLDSALLSLTKLVTTYKDSYDVAYALYMMGRISEQRGKYSEAEQYYTQLKNEYSSSNWSKLAQNRIIYLKIQGEQEEGK
jgi:predicted negative regulator of RcsB-dependent stress response